MVTILKLISDIRLAIIIWFSLDITTLQPFNSLFSRTTWVSRYQKGKTNLEFTGARDSEWQWHQLGHMQVCTSLQTLTTPVPHHGFSGRMPWNCFIINNIYMHTQPTASKHWRHSLWTLLVLIFKMNWLHKIFKIYKWPAKAQTVLMSI